MSNTTSTQPSNPTPNPTLSLFIFIVLTTIYSFVQYNNGVNKLYFIIYILSVIIIQFFINLNLTKTLCGFNQWSIATIVTFIPWSVIFGILFVLLSMFPGWLIPFSNTFGYGVALLAGIGNLMNNILEPNPKGNKNIKDSSMREALAHIYSDKSLLINEITQTNFEYFWNNMKGVFKPGVYSNTNLKNQLLQMVNLKYIVSEYIWFILTGILITSISFNYIVNIGCNQSAAEMKKRHDEYENNLKTESQKPDNRRIYSSTE